MRELELRKIDGKILQDSFTVSSLSEYLWTMNSFEDPFLKIQAEKCTLLLSTGAKEY